MGRTRTLRKASTIRRDTTKEKFGSYWTQLERQSRLVAFIGSVARLSARTAGVVYGAAKGIVQYSKIQQMGQTSRRRMTEFSGVWLDPVAGIVVDGLGRGVVSVVQGWGDAPIKHHNPSPPLGSSGLVSLPLVCSPICMPPALPGAITETPSNDVVKPHPQHPRPRPRFPKQPRFSVEIIRKRQKSTPSSAFGPSVPPPGDSNPSPSRSLQSRRPMIALSAAYHQRALSRTCTRHKIICNKSPPE
ncbi:hypothetical protein P7C70_g4120, partial [Phenoliferia sp. Uapishka_3]